MKEIYKGRVIDLTLEEVHLPNGRVVELEMVRHPGASAIVPLRTDERVVMIRQYRHAAGGFIYEIPAGKLEGAEDPLTCAQRELEEEVGLTASRWESLTTILTTPGFTDEKIHLFLARDLQTTKQKLDHDEVIEVEEIPLEQLILMIRRKEVVDGKTICAVLLTYFHINGD